MLLSCGHHGTWMSSSTKSVNRNLLYKMYTVLLLDIKINLRHHILGHTMFLYGGSDTLVLGHGDVIKLKRVMNDVVLFKGWKNDWHQDWHEVDYEVFVCMG